MNYYKILQAKQCGNANGLTAYERQFVEYLKKIDIKTLTGVPPLTFVSDGSNLVDWSISGAAGGVGDRTKNLLDITVASGTYKSGGANLTYTIDKTAGTITLNGTSRTDN